MPFCASNAAILFSVLHDPMFWVLLRGFCGYALAGAFVVIESWMTDKASEANRGRVFAMYTTASWAASGVSPLLLNFDAPGGILLFVLVTIGLSAAMIPLAVTKVGNPDISEHQHLPLSRLFRASPTGVVCAFGSGMMNAGLYGLFPAYYQGSRLWREGAEPALFHHHRRCLGDAVSDRLRLRPFRTAPHHHHRSC